MNFGRDPIRGFRINKEIIRFLYERMEQGIQIVKKPDWVSWDDIHVILNKAHEKNRRRGIKMRKASLSGEKIKEELGDSGVMFVAMDIDSVVGTAALVPRSGNSWYNNGPYGYMCFASVLPEYSGKGIYKALCVQRESMAKSLGLNKLYVDTHKNNKKLIQICLKNGYKKVGIRVFPDHQNVVLFKWLDGCPYSTFRCWFEYYKRIVSFLLKSKVKRFLGR